MITNRQIRAGRALLGWSQMILASRADVAPITVKRLESSEDGFQAQFSTVAKVKEALEEAGVDFIPDDDEHRHGVRLREP